MECGTALTIFSPMKYGGGQNFHPHQHPVSIKHFYVTTGQNIAYMMRFIYYLRFWLHHVPEYQKNISLQPHEGRENWMTANDPHNNSELP
jgi:hypothetical protein